MIVILLLISVHLASSRFLVSMPVLRVVYGNIGSMDDLMLPPQSRRADLDNEVNGDHEELPDFPEFLTQIEEMHDWNLKLNSTSQDFDMKDLGEVSKTLTDLKNELEMVAKDTRRQNGQLNLPTEVNKLWRNPRLLREWYYQKLSLSFLIHIRFQVDTAIRQKMSVNSAPSYRVGYLFSRLTRVKVQMQRILEEWYSMRVERLIQNRPNWRTKKHGLQMVLHLYERMLQLDVDCKDTVEMIKLAYRGRKMFQTEYMEPTTQPYF